MTVIVGLGAIAALTAWITRVADSRGRSAFGWASLALGLAVLGFGVALRLVERAAAARDDAFLILAFLAPPALAGAAVAMVGLALVRLPIKTSSSSCWRVHDLQGGALGELALVPGALRVALASELAIPLAQLRTVRADGECIRLGWDDGTAAVAIAVMPRGKPDTPAGRKAQCVMIERRIQHHRQAGSVGALPAAKLLP